MKICEAGRSSGCCRNPDIRTINTMGADTAGNFEIRAGTSVSITTETNGIRIAYTGGITTYTNTDGNLDIDNVNFTIDLANDIAISGDMAIAGDLTVNGTYYTVHAEHVYTQDDYIIMRDGAVTGLGSGDFSGFQVKLYDGTNDGRLVIDNSGVARVGDVGDEQPLLTRDEAADLTNGNLLEWDGTNQKAIDGGIAPSNIQSKLSVQTLIDNTDFKVFRWGQMVHISFINHTPTQVNTPYYAVTDARVPHCISNTQAAITNNTPSLAGFIWINPNDYKIGIISNTLAQINGSLTYMTNDP